jgi:GGDEF domain-containing protein
MADTPQSQQDPSNPWVARAAELQGAQQAPPSDQDNPWVARARELKTQQQPAPAPAPSDPDNPWVARSRELQGAQSSGDDDEVERMGVGQSFLTKPVTTSVLGWGEYRKGASGAERGVEKFASSLLSPLSIGLIAVTGGLGGLAEAGAATAGEEVASSLAGRAGQLALSKLAPEAAASVARAAGVASKLASAGFTAQQILGLTQRVPQFTQALRDGDYDKAAEYGTQGLLEGVMTGLSATHLMKTMSPTGEPVITKDQHILAASEQPQKMAGIEADRFRETNKALIKNHSLDIAARLYHEAGGDPATLERWRQEVVDDNNIKPAIQQKYDAILKQAQNLPDPIRKLSADLRVKYAAEWGDLQAIGKADAGSQGHENYSGQHKWDLDDEGGNSLRNVGTTRKLTKSPAFTKRAEFGTIVDALKAGFEPKDIGLAGAREEYIRDQGRMYGAFAADQEALKYSSADGRPVAIEPAKVISLGKRLLYPVRPGEDIADVGERRADVDQRKRIDEMTPDEMRKTLLTSDVTGLPNRRAFNEQTPSPAVAMSDADGLKALNDRYGYHVGDALLRAKADALRTAGLDAYHEKGDEFLFRGNSKAELAQKLEAARNILRSTVFDATTRDGRVVSFTGVDFSYGAEKDLSAAETELKQHKATREAAGQRGRGQLGGIHETQSGRGVNQAEAPKGVTRQYRPEDFLRRVGADKAAILREGVSDIDIQNLRDAIKAGQPVGHIEVVIDKDGNVLQASGLYRASAALQAGVENVPVSVRKITGEIPPGDRTGKWPVGSGLRSDDELLGQAVREVAEVKSRAQAVRELGKGKPYEKLDAKTRAAVDQRTEVLSKDKTSYEKLDAGTRTAVNRRVETLKTQMKTAAAANPTAVRRPIVEPGENLVMHKGKLYYDVTDYKDGPETTFARSRVRDIGEDGKPIFERAALKFHPDYQEPMRRMFDDQSWVRKNPILRGALYASSQAKRSLLGFFSPFHITTEGLRGVQMGLSVREVLNPAPITESSLSMNTKFSPSTGVMNQRSLVAEGVAENNALIHKIPGIGPLMAKNEEFLFGSNGYIDRLKSASFEKVVGQLTKRHPNWNPDQVHFASSKIVDAAYGGLNWKMLGRSLSDVDMLRLVALAPDFTGSQLLFAYHGLEPGGSVVGQSLMRIAMYNFGVARVLNMMTTGKLHVEHPFSVVSPDEKKIYSIRTMPSDILHAITDPGQFTYNRLNPLLVRTTIEALTGRDEKGKAVSAQHELHDLVRNIIPISLQNVLPGYKREDEGIGTSLLRSGGIAAEPNVSNAYKVAGQLASGHSESGPVQQDKLDQHQQTLQLEDALRSGSIKLPGINEAVENHVITQDQAKEIYENYRTTEGMDPYVGRLYSRALRLPMKEIFQVYDAGTDAEKKVLFPLMEKKAKAYLKKSQTDMTPEQRAKDETYARARHDFLHLPLF